MKRSWKIIVIGVFAIFVAANAAAATCKAVTGRISPLQLVTDPTSCFIPSAQCFQGTLTGDFNGSFQSVLTSLEYLVDNANPGSFTATTIVVTRRGTMVFSDVGYINFDFGISGITNTLAAEILTLNSEQSSGDFYGGSGHIAIQGSYVPPGQGFGDLSGQICFNK